jgi:predicted ATP-binding protein involved in virulence
MYVFRLHAVNFRRFPEVKIDLRHGFNLLIGDNQSGKTAILDALAIGLSCFFQGFSTGTSMGIDKSDVRLAQHKLGETIQMPAQYPVRIKCSGEIAEFQVTWERGLKSARHHTGRALTKLGEIGGILEGRVSEGKAIDLPVIACFGTERVSRERRTRPGGIDSKWDRSLGYKDCLERASNLRLIRDWMKRQTLAEVQKGQRGIASSAGEQLRAIEKAVVSCIPEIQQFFYDLEYKDLAVVFTDQRRLPWSMLSDGVRSLATMAMDLGWRAAVLNPHLGSEAPARATGVVLVDEIDLALHPKWQIRVINDLVRTFPRLQFVATTHSPLVLAGAESAHVLQLDGTSAYPLQHVYGQDSNTVLSHYMDGPTRAAEVQLRLDAAADLIDQDRLPEAEKSIDELETQLGTNNTELVRLRTALEFLHPPKPGQK